jgi:hypothetical protein
VSLELIKQEWPDHVEGFVQPGISATAANLDTAERGRGD